MDLSFHPSAQAAFNKKAGSLLQLVEQLPPDPSGSSFPTQQHISATLTDKDLRGEPRLSWVDYQGNTVGKMFLHDGKQYGFKGHGYEPISNLAHAIRKVSWAADMLSQQFIEQCLFEWLEMRFKGKLSVDDFCVHLIQQSNKAIRPDTSWIPIANLEIQAPFPVIGSELRPIDKDTVEYWLASVKGPAEELNERRAKLGERLRKYQGLAAVVTTVIAEPGLAAARAVQQANRVASALALYSPGMLIPDVKSLSRLKGSETLAQVTRFTPPEAGGFLMAVSIVDRASAGFWRLSNQEIHLIRNAGLDSVSKLFSLEKPNDFQEAIINALSIYSKAAFTADPVEKLVFVLSSLESLLLKGDKEGIQQNLGERLALISVKELDKRKRIVANIREVYGIRSRYLHHGRPSSETADIREFLMTAFNFYTKVVANGGVFEAQADFVTWIDEIKLSGPG